MAQRRSTALANFLNSGGSLRQALAGGEVRFYSGPQPTLANDAQSGTLLVTFTKSGSARTKEVAPLGVVTIAQTGAGTGSVDTFTVNSLEIMGSATTSGADATATAVLVCRKINNNPKNLLFVASNVLGVVTITGKPGLGALYNTKALAASYTTGSNTLTTTITSTTFGSGSGGGTAGVDSINGLQFEVSAAGVMVKNTDDTWQGTAVADGTAGHFRWYAAVNDPDTADSSAVYNRLDGSIASSGADFNGATAIVNGAVQTISADQFTMAVA